MTLKLGSVLCGLFQGDGETSCRWIPESQTMGENHNG